MYSLIRDPSVRIVRAEPAALVHHDQGSPRAHERPVDRGFKREKARQVRDVRQTVKTQTGRAHFNAKSLDQIQMGLFGLHQQLMFPNDPVAIGLLDPQQDDSKQHERQQPQNPPLIRMPEIPEGKVLHTALPRKKMSTPPRFGGKAGFGAGGQGSRPWS